MEERLPSRAWDVRGAKRLIKGWTWGGDKLITKCQKIRLKSEVSTSPTWKRKKGSFIDIDLMREMFFFLLLAPPENVG